MEDKSAGEKTFLNESGVTVTNARFIVPSQTFAMSGITSVKAFKEEPRRFWPVIFLLGGIFCLLGGRGTLGWAVILLFIGGIWLIKQKAVFHVILTTASGEAKALSIHSSAWISKVVGALND